MAIKRLATPLESIEYLLEKVDNLKSGDIHITTDTTNTKTVQSELERIDERIDEIESGGGGSEYEIIIDNKIIIEYDDNSGINYNVYFDIPILRDKSKPITDYFMTLTDLTNYVNVNKPLLKKFGIYEEESTEIVYAVWEVEANSVDDQPYARFEYFTGGTSPSMGRTDEAYVWVIEQVITDENGLEYDNLIIEGGK